jgi:hypothetical protein
VQVNVDAFISLVFIACMSVIVSSVVVGCEILFGLFVVQDEPMSRACSTNGIVGRDSGLVREPMSRACLTSGIVGRDSGPVHGVLTRLLWRS